MIWTEKHDQAIERTFKELLEALSSTEDGFKAKEKLTSMGWPHGTQEGPETASQRVRREMANLAVVEHCKKIMEKTIGAIG